MLLYLLSDLFVFLLLFLLSPVGLVHPFVLVLRLSRHRNGGAALRAGFLTRGDWARLGRGWLCVRGFKFVLGFWIFLGF